MGRPTGTAPSFAAWGAVTELGSNATSMSIAMPSGVAANDLLVVFLSMDGAPTAPICDSSAFRMMRSSEGNAALFVGMKRAVGGEGSITCSWTGSEMGSGVVGRISGGVRTVMDMGYNAASSASTGNADPASRAWDIPAITGNARIVTFCAVDTQAFTADPSTYSLEVNLPCTTCGAADAGGRISSKSVSASPENPGTLTNTSDNWACTTHAYIK
jgi:hypothetical protein